MKKVSVPALCALFLLAALSGPLVHADGDPGIEDEFAALVEKVGDLVSVLERQMLANEAERSLDRVAVVTRLLDIRVRQQSNLQKELDSIDSQEQRYLGYIASNEIKLDNLDNQIAVAIDEAKKIELQSRQNEIRQYTENHEGHLERLEGKRGETLSRIAEGERRVREVEDLVQDWLGQAGDRD